jgi:hypothetical protein
MLRESMTEDGKTFAQEANDSATMLGGVMLATTLMVGIVVGIALQITLGGG